MNFRRLMSAALAALFVVAPLSQLAQADEGMWAFNNVPRAEIKRRYGFDVTDSFLMKLQQASVRFPNGSGSFVSPDGLVLTNYHIVEDSVGELSTAEKDYAKEGFVARTRADELKIPGMELNVLMSIEDVTDRISGAAKAGASAAEAFGARQAETAAIEKESTQKTGFKSQVVTLYQGGRYNLYRYKRYTDVRLVFAPEFQAAFFGGDPDNFEFPRFNIDMALVRAYEGDKPARVENYFTWSKQGAKDGDLVFVTGHPGSTQRLNTVAHLESLRDVSIPLVVRMLERREAMLKKYMAGGEEQTRRAQSELNSIQNGLKVYRGQLAGLQDKKLIGYKEINENMLMHNVSTRTPQLKQEYSDARAAISKARAAVRDIERDRRFLDLSAAFNTPLFQWARGIVRLAEESGKPNEQRLPGYTDANRPSLEHTLFAETPLYDDYEKLKLADSLDFMRETYGADHELVKRVLQGKTPEARAAELVDGTKLKSVEARRELVKGGRAAVEASTDPMIQLARSIDKEARAANSRYNTEVQAVERASYAKIARALFETEGDRIYPDATFTLRLSFGAVKGYTEDGKKLPAFTTLGGLYERADKMAKFPWVLPPRWAAAKSKVDPKTPFNFVSTNDIIGGNSGSPIVNKEGELVGLIFDGNRQSLVGNFYYDESVNRAISVDSRGMLEILRKVFAADHLVAELTGGAAKGQTAGR